MLIWIFILWLPYNVLPSGDLVLTHKPVFTGEDQTNMLVSELIDGEMGQWNKQKVHELFAPSTRCEILAIPLNALHKRDELE